MPMPPIHWVMARHMCMPWLISFTDSITDAPVVVKPDMASKNASVKESGCVQKRKGMRPKRENTTHTSDVSR